MLFHPRLPSFAYGIRHVIEMRTIDLQKPVALLLYTVVLASSVAAAEIPPAAIAENENVIPRSSTQILARALLLISEAADPRAVFPL